MAISTGQFTIVDYNDAVTLTGFIGSNLPKVQSYSADTDTYSPDWSSSSLILTAELYRLGTATEIFSDAGERSNVNSVTWTRKRSNDDTFTALSGDESTGGNIGEVLTVSANVMGSGINAVEYLCTISYSDPISGLDLTHKMSITLSKVIQGNNVALAVVFAPDGNTFKNSAPASLTANCNFYRGGTLDTTLLSYQWQKYDGTWGDLTGETSDTTTITPDDVPSMARYRCKVTDNDSSSTTYNETFTSDAIVFIDYTDPIQVVIESTGGNVFKNGVGTTDLTAILYRNGEEIDAGGTEYTYTWTILDKDGNSTVFGDSSSSKNGKTIPVDESDVDTKSTFVCTIT